MREGAPPCAPSLPLEKQCVASGFNQMVENGNTLYIIEHNLDIIKSADYIIEMGPGPGEEGGKVIFTGTPQQMIQSKHSITAKYL